MNSRLYRALISGLLAFVAIGCGGNHGSVPVDNQSGQIQLVGGEAGEQAYAISFRDAAGSNADVSAVDTSNALAFETSFLHSETGGDNVNWRTLKDRRQITFSLGRLGGRISVGDTFTLDRSGQSGMSMVDEGSRAHSYYRSWRSSGGTARIVSLTDQMVEVAAEGVRMEPTGGKICGDGSGCIDNTASGAFTVDLTLRFPRWAGSATFTGDSGSNVMTEPMHATDLDVIGSGSRLWDHTFEASLWSNGDPDYRWVNVILKPSDAVIRPGQVFDLAGVTAEVQCGNATRPGDPRTWRATSGTATVVAIKGNVVTVKVENASMAPRSGDASGAFVVNATIAVPTN